MNTISVTYRQVAMNWWNNLVIADKAELCQKHIVLTGYDRKYQTLTGREIESIFNAEKYNTPSVVPQEQTLLYQFVDWCNEHFEYEKPCYDNVDEFLIHIHST